MTGAFKPKLGERARDKITGFAGVLTARYEFLHGCTRWSITGRNHHGDPVEYTVDEPQLQSESEDWKEQERYEPQQATGGVRDVHVHAHSGRGPR